MDRRQFLAYGSAGVSSAVLLEPSSARAQTATCTTSTETATAPHVHIKLAIMDVRIMMVDGTPINMLGYRDMGSRTLCRSNPNDPDAVCGAVVPGPVLRVQEGWTVRITVENTRPESHGFQITGVPDSRTVIAGRSSQTVEFKAPPTGTYIYHDNLGGEGLYRILGLAGAFIVQPDYCQMTIANPYGTRATAAIKSLFRAFRNPKALGDAETAERFTPGAWVPTSDLSLEYSSQEKVWAMSQVDPKFHDLITPNGITSSSLTREVVENFVPRYFMMNGRSGFDLSNGDDVVCKNYIGEPTLVRTLNLGMAHHCNHIHGNHIFELSESALINETFTPALGFGYERSRNSGRVILRDNILERDVWPMWPMQRKDVVIPYEVPKDIPVGQFAAMVRRGISVERDQEYDSPNEPFPLRYVMHCHCEMSQTAGGGNYPQGMVTHWEILGGKRPTVISSL